MYKSFTDGGSTTDTSTTQETELGTQQVVDGEGGPVIWIYVYNDDPSNAWFEGCVVVREAAASATHAATKGMAFDGIRSGSAALRQNQVLGVAQGVVATGEYGWIAAKGVCTVKGDGSVAADEHLATHTTGLADTASSAEIDDGKAFGIALTADDAATVLATCIIDCL